jgi:hypothetical protein
MIRGNRLVIPVGDPDTHFNRSYQSGDKFYNADVGQRMELSLEECEAIIRELPMLVQFVIEESKEKK